MKNFSEAERLLMEAALFAREGKDPSLAIENQERRGQADVVRNRRLPKQAQLSYKLESKGVKPWMDAEQRHQIYCANQIAYTLEKYAQLGIIITGEYDDLFYNVTLPENWEIRATDHTMWNELVDAEGRVVAKFFYKAAIYDRSAFIRFTEATDE